MSDSWCTTHTRQFYHVPWICNCSAARNALTGSRLCMDTAYESPSPIELLAIFCFGQSHCPTGTQRYKFFHGDNNPAHLHHLFYAFSTHLPCSQAVSTGRVTVADGAAQLASYLISRASSTPPEPETSCGEPTPVATASWPPGEGAQRKGRGGDDSGAGASGLTAEGSRSWLTEGIQVSAPPKSGASKPKPLPGRLFWAVQTHGQYAGR